MYIGKHDVFNAPTVHLDEVETLAPGTTVLATNAMSEVQSAEICTNGSVAWAVQYHPEYPLRELAAIVRRIFAQPAFDAHRGEELLPGPDTASDPELLADLAHFSTVPGIGSDGGAPSPCDSQHHILYL